MNRFLAGLLVLVSVHSLTPIAEAEVGLAIPLQAKGEQGKPKPLSDARIKQILIEESIANYSGNCPCPYSTARNGSRCGRRSAYSREGGAQPLCYAADVSSAMVSEYRAAHES
ncbi:MAG TPA: hypothetical protein VGC79_13310 [Polyangiaceae bacterium]